MIYEESLNLPKAFLNSLVKICSPHESSTRSIVVNVKTTVEVRHQYHVIGADVRRGKATGTGRQCIIRTCLEYNKSKGGELRFWGSVNVFLSGDKWFTCFCIQYPHCFVALHCRFFLVKDVSGSSSVFVDGVASTKPKTRICLMTLLFRYFLYHGRIIVYISYNYQSHGETF